MTKPTFADKCLEISDKATEGPWTTGTNKPYVILPAADPKEYSIAVCHRFRNSNEKDYPMELNAEFIAFSRSGMPELARRLKTAVAHIRKYSGKRRDDELADELEAMPEERE